MNTATPRNTERLLLAIPIRVLGLRCQQGEFIEDTRTSVVNDRGARIALKRAVSDNDILRIINLNNYQKADFRVVSAVAELAPDRSGFYITFTIEDARSTISAKSKLTRNLRTFSSAIFNSSSALKAASSTTPS